jgi:hypothetical protein
MSVPGGIRRIAAALAGTAALVAWAGGDAQAGGHPGRVAILAPDLALDVEQAAGADLRARGFTVVPEVELYRAIERLGIQENTTAGRRALVRVLRLSATMTIKFPHPDTRLTAHGMLRDRRDRVVGVWRWSPRVDDVVGGTTPAPVAATAPVAAALVAAALAAPGARAAETDGPATVSAPLPVTAATRQAQPPDVFTLAVGPRLLYRRLSYAGAPPGQLTGFETQLPTLGVGLRADWFPLPGVFRGVGVMAQVEQTRSIRSQTPVGSFVSPSRDLGAAAQWRLPRPRLELALDLGMGLHRFDFQAQEVNRRLPRPLPDVAYRYLQAGLELRARAAGRLAMVASSHYRHVFHAGGVTSRDWFPGARIRGLDASAGIECHLRDRVTAAVGMDARLYRLDFRQSTSTRLTSGARDNYYSGWVRLGFRLGTSGS